jgi:hypothetical protein
MKREDLERWLNRGNSFGFQLRDDDEGLEWVMLSKRLGANKFLARFTKEDNPAAFKQQMHIRDYP